MKLFGKNYDNKTLIIGGILTAIACGLPVIGATLIQMFEKIQDFTLNLFQKKN